MCTCRPTSRSGGHPASFKTKKKPLSCVLLLVAEKLASRNATKVIAVDDHTKPSSSSSSSSSSEMKREHSGNPDRLTPPPDPQGGSGIFYFTFLHYVAWSTRTIKPGVCSHSSPLYMPYFFFFGLSVIMKISASNFS